MRAVLSAIPTNALSGRSPGFFGADLLTGRTRRWPKIALQREILSGPDDLAVVVLNPKTQDKGRFQRGWHLLWFEPHLPEIHSSRANTLVRFSLAGVVAKHGSLRTPARCKPDQDDGPPPERRRPGPSLVRPVAPTAMCFKLQCRSASSHTGMQSRAMPAEAAAADRDLRSQPDAAERRYLCHQNLCGTIQRSTTAPAHASPS